VYLLTYFFGQCHQSYKSIGLFKDVTNQTKQRQLLGHPVVVVLTRSISVRQMAKSAQCWILQWILILLPQTAVHKKTGTTAIGSQVFATRCYALHKRGLCGHAVSVCLSMCVRHIRFVDSVKTNKPIFKVLSPSSSATILVFPHQTSWQYSDSDPLNRGVERRWGRLKSRFSTNMWLCDR